MTPVKHHYVPESLLNEFTKDNKGDFYALDLKYKHISPRNISGVCYEKNYYDILIAQMLTRYNLGEENIGFLETDFQIKYENQLPKSLVQIKRRSSVIQRVDLEFLIKAYVNLKQRNKYYLKYLDDQKTSIEPSIKSVTDKFRNHPLVLTNNFDVDKWEREYRETIMIRPDHGKNIQLSGLISSAVNDSSTVTMIISKILKMNFIVLETGIYDYLIISDNPGFTLKRLPDRKTANVFNTDFGDFDEIFFPINSKQGIYFKGFDEDHENNLRRISYGTMTSDAVLEWNRCALYNLNNHIFCENRSYLEMFKRIISA